MSRYRFGGGSPPPTPPPPEPPPAVNVEAEKAAAKSSADAAKAAEKTLARKRGGRQSLVLEAPAQNPIGGSGRTATSLLGGGSYPT